MKKYIISIGIILSVAGIFIYSNSQILNGTDDMINKARGIIPLEQADTADISYVGMIGTGDEVVAWFVCENEHKERYYLPMECRYVGNNSSRYKYVSSHEPTEIVEDIVQIEWNGMYQFLVNNPECETIKFTYNEVGAKDDELTVNGYPSLVEHTPKYDSYEYVFLNESGEEIQ